MTSQSDNTSKDQTPTLDERIDETLTTAIRTARFEGWERGKEQHDTPTKYTLRDETYPKEVFNKTKAAIKQAVYAALVEQMPEKRDDGGDMQVTTMYGIENSAYNEGIDACLSVLSAVLGIGEEKIGMSKLGKTNNPEIVLFWCPGCDESHQVIIAGPQAWGFNGDYEKPTFTPSYMTWLDPNPDANVERKPEWEKFRLGFRCHSFITDGRIQFLSDCTHALANQTIDLPEWKKGKLTPQPTDADRELREAKHIHKDVVETMEKLGYGLMLDGKTFYKIGYELNPHLNTTFTMTQAYEIHNLLTANRQRTRQAVLDEVLSLPEMEDEIAAGYSVEKFVYQVPKGVSQIEVPNIPALSRGTVRANLRAAISGLKWGKK